MGRKKKYYRYDCPFCKGTGMANPDCETCEGNGWVEDEEDGGTKVCPDCDGEECQECET